MKPWRKIASVILMFAFVMARAEAANDVCPNEASWACFGSIEAGFVVDRQSSVARMSHFTNGDLLAEFSGGGSGERKLLTLKPVLRLYFGIPDKEIKEGFPFAFFDYGFAAPVMALKAGFPLGPASVADAVSNIPVRFENMRGELSVDRLTPTRIKYRLELQGQQKQVIAGYWDSAKRSPLADEYEVVEWKSCGLKTYATVGAARQAEQVCPERGRPGKANQ